MEEKMTELIIPFGRPVERQWTITVETEPTPLEIQRWEDDGGAVLINARRPTRTHCRCDANHRAAA
jgi:hypothetical protein